MNGLKAGSKRAGAGSLLACLIAVSCGGGGGGTPAPTPVTNQPPVARAIATPANPAEGQPFTLDASSSTDPENNPLTFAWTQASGAPTVIANPNTARLELNAPEVTANSPAVFRVSVSDGTSARTAEVTVTFGNIAQTPVFALPRLLLTAPVPERPLQLAQLDFGSAGRVLLTEATPGGPVQVWNVRESIAGTTLTIALTPAVSSRFSRPFTTASFGFGGLSIPFFQLAVTEELLDSVRFFTPPQSGDLLNIPISFSVSRPCAIGGWRPNLGATSGVAVARRTGGISFITLTAGGPSVQADTQSQIASTQAMCAFAQITSPLSGTPFNNSLQPLLEDILVYNEGTRRFERYTPNSTSNIPPAQYVLGGAADVQLNATGQLNLIKGIPVSGFFPSQGLALIFTDGQHQGTHRLVVASLDANRQIVQTTHTWPIGVPTDLFQTNLDSDSTPEISIFAPGSSQVIVFENSQPTYLSSLLPPAFLELGLGATSIFFGDYGSPSGNDFAVTYTDAQQVKVFTVP
jgi:hypothetical protein